jgi:hypothetical protein
MQIRDYSNSKIMGINSNIEPAEDEFAKPYVYKICVMVGGNLGVFSLTSMVWMQK